MIRIDLSIANPFKHDPWKCLYQKSFVVGGNKVLEIGFFRYARNIAEFELDLRWKGRDHAGLSLDVGFFGWEMSIAIVDNRHWDHDTNSWQVHNTD